MDAKGAETKEADNCAEYNEFSGVAEERFGRTRRENGKFFASRRLK